MKTSADYTQKVLEVSHLKQYFKVGAGKNRFKVKAVDDISFDVYKKEVFGLVGESGCGKTTTGRSIIRLYRPTNGVVKLDGNVVGAGTNDFYKNLKYRKQEYQIELLKLNQHKYDVYLVKQEYKTEKEKILDTISKNKKEFLNNKEILESSIVEYKNAIFEEKNNYQVELETLLFNYTTTLDKLKKKTKNEFLIEYKALIKALKASYAKKIEGINESAALSDVSKKKQKEEIYRVHQEKLENTRKEYETKIEERSKNLFPKSEYKKTAKILDLEYRNGKEQLVKKHKEFLEQLKKPDYKSIRTEVVKTKLQLIRTNKKVRSENKYNVLNLIKQITKVNSSRKVDKIQLKQLKKEYHEFVEEQKSGIRAAKKMHFSKDAEKNVRKMQMIFQDPISSLNPRMTVQEIISEGLVINGMHDKAAIKEKVVDALELVGLAPEYASRYPHEFSGGQRQRIGIARALVLDPKLIIADEPISALDVSIQAQVINLLSELKEKLDLTILFIAHDLSVVKFFSDRIAVMYFGKMVELATSEELFAHPLHGYTKSLLSAIPQPDPDYEKQRQRTVYSPSMHDYSVDQPQFVEITKGHFVYANEAELEEMRKELGVEKNE